MSPEPVGRRTARVIVIDPADRVLLLHYSGRVAGAAWITPGGGIEPGETPEDAAVRELAEEVGLEDATLGPLVWHGEHYSLNPYGQHQIPRGVYFVCYTDAFDFDGHVDSDEYERDVVTDKRWWTLDEIRASSEAFLPSNLPVLLAGILDGDMPSEPISVDW
jgi:8-oxo-dGTP pyrophosphatase MutT (NUDIX family)